MTDELSDPARRGKKRDSQLIFRRRLALLRRLLRGSAHAAVLIADVNDLFPDVPEGVYDDAGDPDAALRHDVGVLRSYFECVVSYHREQGYTLKSPGTLALLDLPDDELEALGFLLATYGEGELPVAPAVGRMLDRIMQLLPEERRRRVPRARLATVQPRIIYDVPRTTIRDLKRALGRQQVRFAYRAATATHAHAANNTVSPYELISRDGHSYLEGYCLNCDPPFLPNRYVTYRVDRIVPGSLVVLPTTAPAEPPARPRVTVRYRLAPEVARRGDVALWLPDSTLFSEPDGSLVVTAQVQSLWQTRQVLLRYREHCTVLEPPELIAMLRETVARMARVYDEAH